MATYNAVTADPELPSRRVTEREAWSAPGVPVLVLGIALLLLAAALLALGLVQGPGAGRTTLIVVAVLLFIAGSGKLSLRDNAEEITQRLSAEIADRVAPAGVHILESRLTRLSYAAEIAQAMLRQRQASAVVGARQRIVEGAVGMVKLALARLQEEDVVELDEERKAAMVSNLLVVLCSEQATQQVVNTGSLYQ